MAGPGVIDDYLAELAILLPPPIVAELADGLNETYDDYRRRGLAADEAARASLAEFGHPATVIAAFVAANPARRSARSLLLAGPVVGGAWATVLLTQQAWDWPVPLAARVGFASAVLLAVLLLAVASFASRYHRAVRSTALAYIVVTAVDATMLGYVTAAGILTAWPVPLAAALSIVRITFMLRRLPRATVVVDGRGRK
jgi:hypothetical protein